MTRLLRRFRTALDGLGTDFRLAIRRLLRTRTFTVVALGSLTLGIGANTALFSFVHTLFFRPVPGVTDPGRVVELLAVVRGGTMSEWTYPDLDDVRAADTPIETVAGWKPGDGTLAIDNVVQGVRVMYASSGYFPVLGVNLALGRRFHPSEDVGPGQHPVAIISHDLWKTSLGGRVDAVGQVVTLNRTAYTVVGVAPETFRHHWPSVPAIDLWVPLTQHPLLAEHGNRASDRGAAWVQALGRLRPGAGVSEANAALATVFRRLAAEYPETNRDRSAVAAAFGPFPANNRTADTVAAFSLLAFGGLVLLIICANLAGMVLARGATEERDLAIRVALGAGRARLVRGIMIDAGVLAIGGGVLGSIAAWWGTRILGARMQLDLTPGAPVLAFSFLLLLATALAIGLLPALRLTRAGLIGSLKDETRAGGRRPGRLHRWAVAAQVGVAVLSIAVSAAFVQSLSQLDRRDLGFDPDRLLVVSLDLSTQGYDDAARGFTFTDRVLETVRALPGVEAAAVADGLPVDLVGNFTRAARADGPAPDAGLQVEFTRVGAGFFQAVGTRVLRGRGIDPSDTQASPRVVVIGRRLAERLWPGEDALGRQIRLDLRGFGEEKREMPYTVVGVTTDVASSRPTEDWPQLFVALAQHYGRPRFRLLVRGRADAAALTRSVQSAIRSIDPLFLSSAVTSRDLLARSLGDQRGTALAAGGTRRGGTVPVGVRPLRPGGLRGGATHARVRAPHGARRDAREHPARDARRRRAPGRSGPGGGRARGGGYDLRDAIDAAGRRAVQPGGVRADGPARAGRRAPGVCGAGSPGGRRRSCRRASGTVIPVPKPLPFPDADRVVRVYDCNTVSGRVTGAGRHAILPASWTATRSLASCGPSRRRGSNTCSSGPPRWASTGSFAPPRVST
jgi:predicted permease